MLAGWLEAIEGFWLAETLRRSVILYPVVNATHILSLGALVTSAILMDLRVFGLGARIPIAQVIGHLRVVAAIALLFAVSTGALLFSVQPQEYAANPIFLVKLGLLALALVNALVFTVLGLHRHAYSPAALAMAGLSIVLWLSVLMAGRLIAFFD